jgi:hypothetical protein
MWTIRDDLKQSLIVQLRLLAHHADASLIGFGGVLLALDLFFIAVFSVHQVYSAFSNDALPLGAGWRIGRDWSYAETLGYVKLGIIVAALALVRAKRERPIYPALALIFAVTLLDDALRLHEQLGDDVANALALRQSTLGELIVWTIYGVCLSPVLRIAFVRSPQQERSNGLLLLGGFGVLAVFAVVADVAHVVVLHMFRSGTVDAVLTVIEDGGEQITLSLISGLALLVHRELRSRQGTSFLSNQSGTR